jgi:alpha-galactosidase
MVSSMLLPVASFGVAAAAPLGEAPPMGWRSWNAFQLEVDAEKISRQAEALATKLPSKGAPFGTLLSLGFSDLGVDDGWQDCGAGYNGTFHSDAGSTLVNTSRFADLSDMTGRAQGLGVSMGWYLNNCWCSELGKVPGGHGHALDDLRLIVRAGFASVKIDGCGPAHGMELWTGALKSVGAEGALLVENCGNNRRLEDVWSPEEGLPSEENPLPVWVQARPEDVRGEKCEGFQTYRVSRDISPQFFSTMWNLQQMLPFLGEEPLSRPGCWAYPDMLQVANQLSFLESRSHFGAWCVTSSPLVLGFDLTNTTVFDEVYSIIGNELAISVDQSWAGHPGRLVKQSPDNMTVAVAHTADAALPDQSCKYPVGNIDMFGTPRCELTTLPLWQVWSKPMPDSAVAVFVVNIGDTVLERIGVSLAELSIDARQEVIVTDIWKQEADVERIQPGGELSVSGLPSHDSVFFLLEPAIKHDMEQVV